jgi:hypothetical protein
MMSRCSNGIKLVGLVYRCSNDNADADADAVVIVIVIVLVLVSAKIKPSITVLQ